METQSRGKRIAIGVLTVVVALATFAKVGIRIWQHTRKPVANVPILEIYPAGTGSEFPVAGSPGKKVSAGAKPLYVLNDFEDVAVSPMGAQPDPSKAAATYYAVILKPRPETATSIAGHLTDPVFFVGNGQVGNDEAIALGDFRVEGGLLYAMSPDEGTAKEVRDSIHRAMTK